MKRLTIHSIALRNFKGIRELTVLTGGNDLSVFGDNAAGKTTIADSVCWLFWDKDSHGRKDFEVKTVDPRTGEPFHRLEHSVEIEIETPEGERVTLKRCYQEDWVKQRGAAKETFNGHKNLYWVNGVPTGTEQLFRAKINGLCAEELFRDLTDPFRFADGLTWQKRRAKLLEICGDVTDSDVIASNPELAPLPEILGQHTVEDYRKIVASKRTEINKQVQAIPVRIDELNRVINALAPVEGVPDTGAILDKLSSLRDKRSSLLSGGGSAEATKRLREAESELLGIQNQALSDRQKALGDRVTTVQQRSSEFETAKRKCATAQGDIETLQSRLDRMESERQILLGQHREISLRELKSDDSCPSCGQPLPAEKVAAAKEKFNAKKASDLEANVAQGRALKQQMDGVRAGIVNAEEALEEAMGEADKTRQALASASEALESAQSGWTPNAEAVNAESEAVRKIDSIKAEIAAMAGSAATAINEVNQEISEWEAKLAIAQKAVTEHEQREASGSRIKELEDEETRLQAEAERLEHHLYLTEQFVRAKVSLLTDRINSKFSMARFKLFNQLVNGALEECCEVMDDDGVPYGSLNHGSRVNLGLDIVNTLARHYGFAPPVIIDNAESVTSLLPTEGQQIRLVVSAADKTLRFEQAPTTERKAS